MNVMMIGNSFSIPVTKHLPGFVKDAKAEPLYLASCYIGGCSLRLHEENLRKAEKDPEFKPYQITIRDTSPASNPEDYQENIPAMLKLRNWDIVTIQQASHESWDYSFYQPFADHLIAAIRKAVPNAKIVIQKTWSYNKKDGRLDLNNPEGWHFDQTGMFERLSAAYSKLAETYGFKMIPTGNAVQAWRKEHDPETDDVVGIVFPGQNGEPPHTDNIHLNPAGEYLQGAVWFHFLYGTPAADLQYRPHFLSESKARQLRECADSVFD